ncbi:unnamed protein product [Caenorhabditis bovis]|uniref:Uncharacterized protein n=1 Tax=Caenorhabditis bovis TaxID=2654633 RepID=A0A8S1EXF7_9PELO|nr:unnamed protein product [Caenorhabditis bovis]
MQFFVAATRFSTTVTILIVCLIVLLITVQPAEALSSNMQGSLRQSRNCFFSPMGCIFMPKMSRIRKMSNNQKKIEQYARLTSAESQLFLLADGMYIHAENVADSSSNMQGSLRQSRNCFFSPMGCIFMPKMSRIRKMSNDYDG